MKKLKNIEKEIFDVDNPTILYFTAPWCVPCKLLKPMLKDIKDCEIYEVNVEDNNKLANDYGVNGLPTLVFFKNGIVKYRLTGTVKQSAIEDRIKKLWKA